MGEVIHHIIHVYYLHQDVFCEKCNTLKQQICWTKKIAHIENFNNNSNSNIDDDGSNNVKINKQRKESINKICIYIFFSHVNIMSSIHYFYLPWPCQTWHQFLSMSGQAFSCNLHTLLSLKKLDYMCWGNNMRWLISAMSKFYCSDVIGGGGETVNVDKQPVWGIMSLYR